MDSITTALDYDNICESLCYIRSTVTEQPNGLDDLRNGGGIKILVKCLKNFDLNVLSLALSILRTCSVNEECRNELFEYDIIENLCFIMGNINVDMINYRTCRVISNLTASQNHISVIYEHKIPCTLVNMLSNTNCNVTRCSAIQALGKIWENSCSNGCDEMLKYQVVGVVSQFLTSKRKDTVTEVLKAQDSFLTNPENLLHPTNLSLILSQILGNDSSKNMSVIDTFLHLLPEQPIVGKIIYSLCGFNYTIKPVLSNTCLLNYIVAFLKTGYSNYLLLSMCQLLKCPHIQLRFASLEDGINIFMDLLSNTNPALKELALHTLVYLQYSSNLFVALIKKGLIPLLIKELSSYVKMHQICHTHPGITKIQSVDTPTSSSTSPTTSARAACSPPKDDNNATNACSSDCSSDEILSKIPNSLDNSTRGSILIRSLISIISAKHVDNLFAAKVVWDAIFNYIHHTEDMDINLLAIFILREHTKVDKSFKAVLNDGFILMTHRKMCRPIHELDLCKDCEFRNILGVKILTNASYDFQLQLREILTANTMNEHDTSDDNQNLKILISITVPLIIPPYPERLISMLYCFKIYVYLCNIIKDNQNPLFDDAVGAMICLFKTLRFKKTEYKLCENQQNCLTNIVPKETTVAFILDDGIVINANKSFLSLKSPVFEAMLCRGGFKEAQENTIRLHNVSSECFKYILLLLEDSCECIFPTNINVFLELIVITDKYMLNELFEKICALSTKYMSADNENCSRIYQWVKETGHQLDIGHSDSLGVINYLFASNSRFPDRIEAIQNINRSDYGQHFIDDLSVVLKNALERVHIDQ